MKRKPGKSGKLKYRSISLLMLALILAGLIVLNVGAAVLERKKGWRIDLSFNAIASQSPETAEILKNLDTPVKIWALYRKGDEDAPLTELLDRYAAASPQITWEQADPAMNPALLNRFTTDSVTPGSDSLIVWCEKTGRFRVLGPEDYVSIGMDPETGEYSYTGWTYERSLTGAISYVTKERIPRAVILQGHGEMDQQTLAAFETLMTENQYDVAYADLTDSSYTPDPEDLLVFFSPLRDLTETELATLTSFAAQGGSFLFTCDYTDPAGGMPNYEALLRNYGFLPREGIVIADPQDSGTYYNGNQVWLLPEMCPTDLTLDLIATGHNHLLLPGARAFEEPEEGDRNLTTAVVLRSGETSYLKVLNEETVSIEKTGSDPQGAFPLALEARRITAEGYISRAFIIGCSAALADQQLYSMTDSRQMVVRIAEFLLKLDASDLNIMPREAVRPALSAASSGMGSLILVALPLGVLAAALLVLGPRRSR
ncbi:MAG: Gldg family protein [Clostridia bacterium]|nr:Gldg family protein [Clostridia bacterium]